MPPSSGLLLWHLKWRPLQSSGLSVTYQQTFRPRLESGSPPQCPCKGHGPLLLSHIPTPTPVLLHHWPHQGLRRETITILPDRSLSDSFGNRLNSKHFHNYFSNRNVLSQLIICTDQDPCLVSNFPAFRCMLPGRVAVTPTPHKNNKKKPQAKQNPSNPRRPRLPQISILDTPCT